MSDGRNWQHLFGQRWSREEIEAAQKKYLFPELPPVSEPDVCPCSTCGKPTAMLGTKLCNRCWELDSAFRSLLAEFPVQAQQWLRARMRENCEAHQDNQTITDAERALHATFDKNRRT